MRSRNNSHEIQIRQHLADEAARVMIDGGIRDYGVAKRKALERLRLPRGTPLPRNQDIADALLAHQRLFGGDQPVLLLQRLREAALGAMHELHQFQPKLVGAVLGGVVDTHTVVTLHLFADSIEEVAWALMERGIDHRNSEHLLRLSTGAVERVPGFSFIAGDVPMELVVFSGRSRRHTPINSLDGHAMARASLSKVRSLGYDRDESVSR
jgi:hypothetical protein